MYDYCEAMHLDLDTLIHEDPNARVVLVEANGELVQTRLQTRWGSRDFVSKFLSALASKGPAVRRRPDAPRPRFSIIEATASAASRAAEEVDMCVVEPVFGQGPRGQAGCLRRTTTVDAVLRARLLGAEQLAGRPDRGRREQRAEAQLEGGAW